VPADAEADPDATAIAGLELHGTLPPRPRAAIVGARAAHLRFRELVPIAVEALVRHGWSLVSGGALGIDGDAHRAALAQGLPQLAVLPCGADRPYPPAHAGLFTEILHRDGSGLLYTQPRGREPARAMFVSRNRHVVALCDAVLVVEAERPSGTLHTGRMALRRGLAVAAITGSRGADDLVLRGAVRLPVQHAALGPALDRWLVDRAAPALEWPLHLLWLRDALATAGSEGLSPDAMADPLDAALAFTEAELLGLVLQARPGTWRAVEGHGEHASRPGTDPIA
jgi:DNA protecting protein DprA